MEREIVIFLLNGVEKLCLFVSWDWVNFDKVEFLVWMFVFRKKGGLVCKMDTYVMRRGGNGLHV
jgi:hypothetical protein